MQPAPHAACTVGGGVSSVAVDGLLDRLGGAFIAELWGAKTMPLLLDEVNNALGQNMKQGTECKCCGALVISGEYRVAEASFAIGINP